MMKSRVAIVQKRQVRHIEAPIGTNCNIVTVIEIVELVHSTYI